MLLFDFPQLHIVVLLQGAKVSLKISVKVVQIIELKADLYSGRRAGHFDTPYVFITPTAHIVITRFSYAIRRYGPFITPRHTRYKVGVTGRYTV